MDIYYYTHTGHVRNENQDCLLVGNTIPVQGNMEKPETCIQEAKLFAVADGMGGLSSGRQASRFIIEKLNDLENHFMNDSDGELIIKELSKRLSERSSGKIMGTTLTAVKLLRRSILVLHIGDTRLYRMDLNRGQLRRLTTDHSKVQELLDANLITEDQMRTHPHSNILTSCLDSTSIKKTPAFAVFEKADSTFFDQNSARYLLTSDGLWGMIETNRLQEIMAMKDLKECATSLQMEAFAGGANDNISFILFQ